MQTAAKKRAIVQEAYRLLETGGTYAIHELCLRPDQFRDYKAQEIYKALSQTIHVHAEPLTALQWENLLKEAGFEIADKKTIAMSLLKPLRVLYDEGLFGAVKFACNVLANPAARRRIA